MATNAPGTIQKTNANSPVNGVNPAKKSSFIFSGKKLLVAGIISALTFNSCAVTIHESGKISYVNQLSGRHNVPGYTATTTAKRLTIGDTLRSKNDLTIILNEISVVVKTDTADSARADITRLAVVDILDASGRRIGQAKVPSDADYAFKAPDGTEYVLACYDVVSPEFGKPKSAEKWAEMQLYQKD